MSDVGTGSSALADAGVTFDRESGELGGPDGSTRLAPQPAALLALLLEDVGNVVSRSRIRSRLWPGGHVEFDQGIAFAVREVRKALEEVGVDPGLVETLPRRGFRVAAGDGGTSPPGGRRRQVPWPAVAGGILFGLLVGVILVSVATGGAGAATPMVAVFPYGPVDGSSSVAGTSVAEAVTARLTSDLAGEAGVIGPTGTAGLAGPDDTERARATLGVCMILSGSLRPLGPDYAVVFTQLVRTSDRVHVWAQLDTLWADDVAATVARAAVEPVRAALPDC